jgi:hypothetical protein
MAVTGSLPVGAAAPGPEAAGSVVCAAGARGLAVTVTVPETESEADQELRVICQGLSEYFSRPGPAH